MTQTVPQRSEIAVDDTWDLHSIFPSDQAWEAEMARVEAELPELSRFRGQLGQSAALLAEWLETADRLQNIAEKVYNYGWLSFASDTTDQTASAKRSRALNFYSRVLTELAFGQPEILTIGFEQLRQWSADEPRLAVYDHFFDQLWRRQAHVRSGEVEELLSAVQAPFASARSIHSTLADADMRFAAARDSAGAELEMAQGRINSLLTDPDREARRSAWESYADSYLALKNTLANCLTAGVQQNVFMARARRYDSALEASLSENFIPVPVFTNLIETFRKHLPTWHRYWNIRRRALGYDKLHVYDIKAPLTASTPHVSFDQSIEYISAGMLPLGQEYVSVMRDGLLEQRWVDRYPNQGKRSGAFSSGVKGTHPFILMSYVDDLFSTSTLAHELGHSMHSYYTWQNQPLVYADYTLFVAEVASNFNQALVRAHLLRENSDPDFQIAVIEEAMSNFHRYFFIMPTLARFELEIHQRVERGEALSADSLIALMADLFRDGYGDEVEIDADRIGITWAQFATHMYANFYVYQYATGIAAAHSLAEGVLNGAPGAVENYLAFLKAGNSLYPLDALKLAGVDMTSPEPVEKAFGVLASFVDRLEELTQPGARQ
jgi:oligoendopeptidase F